MLRRKVTYRLYPKPAQEAALFEQLRLHQQLYNAMLQQRIEAYRRGTRLGKREQEAELKFLRAECPEFAICSCDSQQVTVKRVDLAFKAFFRRVRAGEKRPGFPRFRSLRRFSGWGYKEHGCGWRLHAGEGGRRGPLRPGRKRRAVSRRSSGSGTGPLWRGAVGCPCEAGNSVHSRLGLGGVVHGVVQRLGELVRRPPLPVGIDLAFFTVQL